VVVEGDATRLAQIVANLLGNAAKFTPAGGDIAVTLDAEGTEAVVRVRDNGCGIDPGMLPRVFGLFVQERRSGEAGNSGLGIGLALAQRLVKAHGGTLTAASDGRGHGSTFVVRLPLAEQPAAVAPPPAPPPAGTLDVVVCDDNVDAANLLAELLRLHGHAARVAYSGGAAVALAAARMPDAAVLDIGLPDMDGCEVARRIRALPGAQPTLIALTGWGQDSDRTRAHDAGFDHHLTKPAEVDALLALLVRRPEAVAAT
jgi:CheY-like chemotaxis protein